MGTIETKSKNKSGRVGDKNPKGTGSKMGALGKQGAAGEESRKKGGAPKLKRVGLPKRVLPAGASAEVQARLLKGLLLLGSRVQVLLAPALSLRARARSLFRFRFDR